VGRSVAGRVHIFVRGEEYGDFAEPCCVLQPFADHLLARAKLGARAWAEQLAPLGPLERFAVLDGIFYSGNVENPALETQLRDACFLTNESEAFDPIKGFVLRDGLNMQILLRRDGDAAIEAHIVPVTLWAEVANNFGAWLSVEQTKLWERFGRDA
jgi:hypothetical protein